jgi:hypothetical protein
MTTSLQDEFEDNKWVARIFKGEMQRFWVFDFIALLYKDT